MRRKRLEPGELDAEVFAAPAAAEAFELARPPVVLVGPALESCCEASCSWRELRDPRRFRSRPCFRAGAGLRSS